MWVVLGRSLTSLECASYSRIAQVESRVDHSVKSRILVIGGGSIGERHVRCFLQTDRAEVSLCEINPAVRDRLAGQYALAAVFDTMDDALAAGAWDAAVVCTPAHIHVPLAIQLAKHGVHTLIEKPLSTTMEDVDTLSASVDESGTLCAVAYVYRSHPALAAMKEAIASGRVGQPVQVVVNSGQHFPFYRPAYRETYYTDRALGGGAIQDALTHFVNAVEWLVGPTTRLVADAEHLVLNGVDVEDTVNVLARNGDVLVSYSLNQHQHPNETSITVIGDQATARFEVHEHQWMICKQLGGGWVVEEQFEMARDTLFLEQAHQFLDAMDNQSPGRCTLAEGVHTLRANRAILRSLESRSWEHLDRE